MATKKQRRIRLHETMMEENKKRHAEGLPMLQRPKDMRAILQSRRDKAKNIRRIIPSFYSTVEWKRLRYATLVKSTGKCLVCGASAKDGAVLRVDQIKSVRRYPHLKLDPNNVQVICNSCNWGKGGDDETDWRGNDPRYGEIMPISNDGRSIA